MMRRYIFLCRAPVIAGFMSLAVAAPASETVQHKADLADALAGTYEGNVISDSKGSSKSDVTLTLARVAPNTVQITSDYPRLPVITVKVSKAMSQIVNVSGDTAFFFDPTKSPPHLDVSFHNEVSWSGEKH